MQLIDRLTAALPTIETASPDIAADVRRLICKYQRLDSDTESKIIHLELELEAAKLIEQGMRIRLSNAYQTIEELEERQDL